MQRSPFALMGRHFLGGQFEMCSVSQIIRLSDYFFHCLSEKEGNLEVFSSSYTRTLVISEALCHLFSFLFISTACRCLCGCSLYKEQIFGICDRMICFVKSDAFYFLEKVVLQLSVWIWMHSNGCSEWLLFWR